MIAFIELIILGSCPKITIATSNVKANVQLNGYQKSPAREPNGSRKSESVQQSQCTTVSVQYQATSLASAVQTILMHKVKNLSDSSTHNVCLVCKMFGVDDSSYPSHTMMSCATLKNQYAWSVCLKCYGLYDVGGGRSHDRPSCCIKGFKGLCVRCGLPPSVNTIVFHGDKGYGGNCKSCGLDKVLPFVLISMKRHRDYIIDQNTGHRSDVIELCVPPLFWNNPATHQQMIVPFVDWLCERHQTIPAPNIVILMHRLYVGMFGEFHG